MKYFCCLHMSTIALVWKLCLANHSYVLSLNIAEYVFSLHVTEYFQSRRSQIFLVPQPKQVLFT